MKTHSIREALGVYTAHVAVNTVIDVGINTHTDYLVDVFPGAKHYLFEPVSQFYRGIAENYRNIDHVLIPKAVSDSSGKQWLNLTSNADTREITHSSLDTNQSNSIVDQIEVDVVTLDDYFTEHPIDLSGFNSILKIDVDSVEYKILQGASDISQHIGLMIIECHQGQLPEITTLAKSLGFMVWDIVSAAYYCDQFVQCDILFINTRLTAINAAFRPWEAPFKMDQWVHNN